MNGDDYGTMSKSVDIATSNQQKSSPELLLEKDHSKCSDNGSACDTTLQHQENGSSLVSKADDSTAVIKQENKSISQDHYNKDEPLKKLQGGNPKDSVSVKDKEIVSSDKEQVTEKGYNSNSLNMQPSKIDNVSKNDCEEGTIKQEKCEKIKDHEKLTNDKKQINEKGYNDESSQNLQEDKPSKTDDSLFDISKNDGCEASIKQNKPDKIKDDQTFTNYVKPTNEKSSSNEIFQTLQRDKPSKTDDSLFDISENDNNETSTKQEKADYIKKHEKFTNDKKQVYENINNDEFQNLLEDKLSKIENSLFDTSKNDSNKSFIKEEPNNEKFSNEKDNNDDSSQYMQEEKFSKINLCEISQNDSNTTGEHDDVKKNELFKIKNEQSHDGQDYKHLQDSKKLDIDGPLDISKNLREGYPKLEDEEIKSYEWLMKESFKYSNTKESSQNLHENNSTKIDQPIIDTDKDDNDYLIKLEVNDETGALQRLPSDEEKTNDSTKNSYLVDQNNQKNCFKNGLASKKDFKDLNISEDISMGDSVLVKAQEESNSQCSEISEDGDVKTETLKIVTISKQDTDEEVESIHSSDFSAEDDGHKIDDAVSINSDSSEVIAQESTFEKSNDIIILENESIDNHNGIFKPNEVHEILSDNEYDDCIFTAEEKATKKSPKKGMKAKNDCKVGLRRSSRAIKRKKYDDDVQPLDEESDIEEVVLQDPLKRKSNKNNSNKAVMDWAAKNSKANVNQSKEIVIIDSPVKNRITINKTVNTALNQSIYQRMASRGTSVTPISVKSTSTQASQVTHAPSAPLSVTPSVTPSATPCIPPAAPPAPTILPTLTDDMFVVEAPSFIVPYVYEKPSKVPFKEFLEKWNKELEEEKAKEEHLLMEKKKEEKAKREQERKEKRDRGEEVEESEGEVDSEEVKKKKAEKAEKKERRRRKKEDDDVSWDGSSSEESEDESSSDEEGQNIILKDKIDSIEEIKQVTNLPTETKTDSYFDLFLGKFFMDIGMNLVQEYVQTDLLKQQNRKLQRVKRAGHDTKAQELSVGLLTKNLQLSQKSNESYRFEQKKCELCTFKSESALTMAHHMETPHMKNNLYRCNYCPFEVRSAHDILFHMDANHGVKAKLERAPALHQCPNCPFEDHGKGKLARHQVACARKFKPDSNLAPPVEWEHPAKIAKIARPRHNATNYQVAQFGRHHVDSNSFPKTSVPVMSGPTPQVFRGRPRAQAPRMLLTPGQGRAGGVLIRPFPPTQQSSFPAPAKKSSDPTISITPLPRQQTPAPVQPLHTANAKGVVVCEICDGYIKDLEQLRHHMQWIHKVKIHPKMIYNRPPLNCQKCQFRFFTDQGLERHLLGSHALVTSSMQEAANKGKDAGRCPVCGRVYQWKLLEHVSSSHNMMLKPAHLSYKCTVCSSTFGMYRQFENHVYSAHSVVAKKVIEKKSGAATPAAKATANDNAAKQLKINDQITITPQPAKTTAVAKGK